MQAHKVKCNGVESYAAIVDTPVGEISVHADGNEITIYVVDDKVIDRLRIVDTYGATRKVEG
jgi:hypothetical protein